MRMGEPDCWKSQESAVARPSLGLGLGEWDRLGEEEEGHPLGHTALCRADSLAFFFFFLKSSEESELLRLELK